MVLSLDQEFVKVLDFIVEEVSNLRRDHLYVSEAYLDCLDCCNTGRSRVESLNEGSIAFLIVYSILPESV